MILYGAIYNHCKSMIATTLPSPGSQREYVCGPPPIKKSRLQTHQS